MAAAERAAMIRGDIMSRYYIPTLGNLYARFDQFVLPLLRAGLGIILMAHGCQKLFGMFGGMGLNANAALFERLGYSPGMFWGTLVGCTETFGGALLVLGLFTRPAALAVIIFMIFSIHFTSAKGFFWSAGGMEYSILILLVALVFMIRGGGEYSLDKSIGKEF
jgi:putative oxidoreductase